MSEKNVWGTPKAEINPEEFCVECEREVPLHYDNCPQRTSAWLDRLLKENTSWRS